MTLSESASAASSNSAGLYCAQRSSQVSQTSSAPSRCDHAAPAASAQGPPRLVLKLQRRSVAVAWRRPEQMLPVSGTCAAGPHATLHQSAARAPPAKEERKTAVWLPSPLTLQ
eukprot:CAMPEP_0183352678 /NCGR_PEP_ID=MMETSP0164_2-20130417/29710_1 /TAXON_ID=221442 /ORGANISM="Coccolithus pelagicus ssp braarudi, Strain PLY182g" /LENGTH=112 /DNA_ID=CAMNT_0025525171 /DNA_START=337 /DNA_END=673 /DNA_ORIENTATION=+